MHRDGAWRFVDMRVDNAQKSGGHRRTSMRKSHTKKTENKIRLRTDTVRILRSSELEPVAGGFLDYPTHNCTGFLDYPTHNCTG
jgi:hypothetical protein